METLGLNPGSVFTLLHGTQQWCVCVRTHHLLPTSCLKQREPTFPMVQRKPLPAAERVPPAKFWYCSHHQEEKKRQQKKSLLLSSFPERQAVRAEQWWVLPPLPWPQMLALLPRRQRALASDKGHCLLWVMLAWAGEWLCHQLSSCLTSNAVQQDKQCPRQTTVWLLIRDQESRNITAPSTVEPPVMEMKQLLAGLFGNLPLQTPGVYPRASCSQSLGFWVNSKFEVPTPGQLALPPGCTPLSMSFHHADTWSWCIDRVIREFQPISSATVLGGRAPRTWHRGWLLLNTPRCPHFTTAVGTHQRSWSSAIFCGAEVTAR